MKVPRKRTITDNQNQGWGASRIPLQFLQASEEDGLSRTSEIPLKRIAILGNYLPRQCGIATFTGDLACTLSSLDCDLATHVVAMSDQAGYDYPERVRHEIQDDEPTAYSLAADFLNRSRYDVLSVQHEYGIFGGEAGSYLMELVRRVKMPIVTTLHTVLEEPSKSQRETMDELLQVSGRVVVMSQKAVDFLIGIHGTSRDKIDLIPHGIPNISKIKGLEFRSTLDIDGPLILTFGLLSPDKGIQFVIQALPRVLKQHPGSTYVVVGATHPKVRASVGEIYRESLLKLASDLGIAANVRFVDRFVATEELVDYLGAMDFYVTPYLNPKQITSGPLAYAVGAGKAVISTPYWYAQELLAEGRGQLVPFGDATAISDAVLSILHDPESSREMGRRAAEHGRQMLWPEVGRKYLASFARAKRESAKSKVVPVLKPWPILDSLVHFLDSPVSGTRIPAQLGPLVDWSVHAPRCDNDLHRHQSVESVRNRGIDVGQAAPGAFVQIGEQGDTKNRLTED